MCPSRSRSASPHSCGARTIAEELVRRADERLYEAERAGRNCVRLRPPAGGLATVVAEPPRARGRARRGRRPEVPERQRRVSDPGARPPPPAVRPKPTAAPTQAIAATTSTDLRPRWAGRHGRRRGREAGEAGSGGEGATGQRHAWQGCRPPRAEHTAAVTSVQGGRAPAWAWPAGSRRRIRA